MSLPVAILAGGLATRLRPVTETIPKSLIDVAGMPFIVRQLMYLQQQGISSVVLCIGHLGDQVEEVVGDGRGFGLHVQYSRDGAQLLGTGGALTRALPLLGETFFVLYGDSFLPIDFRAVERAYHDSPRPALMTVLRNGDLWDRSNVIYRDGVVLDYDKRTRSAEMEYIDYGLGVLSRTAFADAPTGTPFDLSDTYRRLAERRLLAGYEVFHRFYEIGSHAGMEDAIRYFQLPMT